MSTAAPLQSPSSNVAASAARVADRQAAAAAANFPQPPDPQLVAEMKQEIRVLVQEIAELAAGDLTPEDFYAGFLTRVVSAMAAVGGAVWIKGESGKLKLAHSVNLAQTGVERSPQDRTRHGLLLRNVMAGTQAILAPPNAAGASEGEASNPTDLLLVLSPLIVEKEAEAVVEVFQRGGGGPSTQRGYLRFLVQMCDVACDYLENRKLRQLTDSQSQWRELEQLVQELHRSLDLQQTAYAVVNEGRRMIGCDRVSLALAYGGQCRIEAVSGLDSIDRRATEVQRLAKLATAVLRTNEPLWSVAGESDLPEQIERPLQEYVDQSHARLVAVLPLIPAQTERHGGRSLQPIGALVIEQLRDARAGEALRTRSELLAQHSAAALTNAIEHSSVFLLPFWKQLGKATWLLRGRTLPKTLLVLAMLIGGITALAVVPTDFEVAARGKLQPAQRSEVFAPLDGIVANVPVRHGQIVEPGTILAELSSTDIELQVAALIGRQTTNPERLAALQRALLDTRSGADRLTPAEENRLGGEMLELRQEAENIDRELVLLRQKQQQLTIVARERGQVMTWKVEDLLLHRPVQRGQGLLTLANPDGPWELELYLPERRLKHVQASQHAESSLNHDVTFTLASHPGQTFHGRVVEIEQAAEVRGEDGNTVLVRVAVEKSELPPLHDQTTVTAKLHCGQTSLGYAWFCDLIETVQSKVLFWLPS